MKINFYKICHITSHSYRPLSTRGTTGTYTTFAHRHLTAFAIFVSSTDDASAQAASGYSRLRMLPPQNDFLLPLIPLKVAIMSPDFMFSKNS